MVDKKRKLLLIGIPTLVVLTAASASAAWYFSMRNDNPDNTGGPTFSRVCSDELIKRASDRLNANDVVELRKIEQGIRQIKDYEKDQNCLLILARGSMLRNDAERSREYVEALKKAYIPEGYSQAFTTSTMTVEQIEAAVKFSEDREKPVEKQEEERRKIDAMMNQAADDAANGGSQ